MYCYWNKPNESQMYNNFYKEWFKIMSFKPSNSLDMMIFIEVNDYCRYFVVSWYVVITGKLYLLHCFDYSTISKTLQWTILMLALHCKVITLICVTEMNTNTSCKSIILACSFFFLFFFYFEHPLILLLGSSLCEKETMAS